MTITSRRSITLMFFFTLLICKRWRILALLIAVYLYDKRIRPLPDVDENFDEIIKRYANMVPNEQGEFYVKAFKEVHKLRDRYPDDQIRRAKLCIINRMLYNLPLTDEAEDEWLTLKRQLLLLAQ